MGLIYDDPRLAALTLTRIAAQESEGPSELAGRMHEVLDDLAPLASAASPHTNDWPTGRELARERAGRNFPGQC